MDNLTELQSLQNHVNNIGIPFLNVHEFIRPDKRKTTTKFYLTINGTNSSPILDYENMNHLLLGVSKGIEIGRILNTYA